MGKENYKFELKVVIEQNGDIINYSTDINGRISDIVFNGVWDEIKEHMNKYFKEKDLERDQQKDDILEVLIPKEEI